MQRTAASSCTLAAALIFGVAAAVFGASAQAQAPDAAPLTLEGAAPAPSGEALPAWMQYSDPYGKKPADLSKAHLANEEVEAWAQERVTDALTFDPATVNSKVTTLRTLFTDAGWASYGRTLAQMQVVEHVRTQSMSMATIANGEANVTNTSDNGGHFRWQVRLPILQSLTTASGAAANSANHTLDVTIIRAGQPVSAQTGEQPLHNDLKIDALAITQ